MNDYPEVLLEADELKFLHDMLTHDLKIRRNRITLNHKAHLGNEHATNLIGDILHQIDHALKLAEKDTP